MNSSTRSTRSTRAAAALTAAVATAGLVVSTGVAAHASGGDAVIKRGSCTQGAAWKIKAKPDNGRIEVEAEIDTNKNGQTWAWTLKHNGSVSASGNAVTKAPSGSFTVRRSTVNLSGTDSYTFRATHGSQVCVAKVSL